MKKAFERQIRGSAPMTLLPMIVDQFNNIKNNKNNNLSKWEYNAMLNTTIDELIYHVSSAKDDGIAQIKNFLDSKGDEDAKRFINNALTNFYKRTHGLFVKAIEQYVEKVWKERAEIMEENTIGADPFTPKDILKGDAPILLIPNDCTSLEYEENKKNNSKGDALSKIWKACLITDVTNDETDDEDDIKMKTAPTGLSYRNSTLNMIKELSKPASRILLEESSAFKDAVNFIFESLSLAPPYTEYKAQQFFKETVEKIRQQGVEAIEEKPSETTTPLNRNN
jgi:hypothetical protein